MRAQVEKKRAKDMLIMQRLMLERGTLKKGFRPTLGTQPSPRGDSSPPIKLADVSMNYYYDLSSLKYWSRQPSLQIQRFKLTIQEWRLTIEMPQSQAIPTRTASSSKQRRSITKTYQRWTTQFRRWNFKRKQW